MERPVHGGLDLTELQQLGLRPEEVVDFSAGINPLGTPQEILDAIADVDPSVYPDRDCVEMRHALSAKLGVRPECILIGNGSTELIHLLGQVYLGPSAAAVVLAPTFGEYAAAAGIAGAEVIQITAEEETGFSWRMEDAVDAIRKHRPSLSFLCNPNNPTGGYLDEFSVRGLARATSDRGLLVIDEAYVNFVEELWDSLPLLELNNVAIMRSMTKDYGLAGLRLGYLLADQDLVEQLRSHQPSWSVNAVAQAAGVAALGCDRHLAEARALVNAAKACLESGLRGLELEPIPSAANFLMVKVGRAADRRRALLQRGMCVRDCSSFGLPDHIRIAVRKPEECRRLVSALREVLADG